MFGSNKKDDLEKMVKKGQWDKLAKKCTTGDEAERVLIAEACVKASGDEPSNMLIDLLKDSSDAVKLAAVKSLEKIGNDHAVTQLQWLLGTLKPEQKELHDTLLHTIGAIRGTR